MAARSRNPCVDSVGSNLERILRRSRTSVDVTNPLQDSYIEGHHAALHVSKSWQNATTQAPQDGVTDVLEKKEIKKELEMSEDKYIPASQTLYLMPEEAQPMLKSAFKM